MARRDWHEAADHITGTNRPDRILGLAGGPRCRQRRLGHVINVATAGPKATVHAGKGYDIVRCNPEAFRRIFGAERISVTKRVKGGRSDAGRTRCASAP